MSLMSVVQHKRIPLNSCQDKGYAIKFSSTFTLNNYKKVTENEPKLRIVVLNLCRTGQSHHLLYVQLNQSNLQLIAVLKFQQIVQLQNERTATLCQNGVAFIISIAKSESCLCPAQSSANLSSHIKEMPLIADPRTAFPSPFNVLRQKRHQR